MLVYARGELIRLPSACVGPRCTVSYQGQTAAILDLRDLDPRDNSGSLTITNQHKRNGVDVARLRGGAEGVNFDTYGAWGMYNGAYSGKGSTIFEGIPVTFLIAGSIGEGSGSNPLSGSATWTGAMVGTKVFSSSLGADVVGDANMQVDFSASTLNLDFTNIAEVGTGTSGPSFGWQGVPMSGGSFHAAGLDGRFYGPEHEEAGGVFEKNRIAGGFTLVRE